MQLGWKKLQSMLGGDAVEQLFGGNGVMVKLLHDTPLVHDQNAIAHAEQLRDVGGDEQDARPAADNSFIML